MDLSEEDLEFRENPAIEITREWSRHEPIWISVLYHRLEMCRLLSFPEVRIENWPRGTCMSDDEYFLPVIFLEELLIGW